MKAYELLDSPEKWTQGHFGKTAAGVGVFGRHADAVCWCLLGALQRCYHDSGSVNEMAIRARLRSWLETNSIISWNDAPERTYDEVISVLKELDI